MSCLLRLLRALLLIPQPRITCLQALDIAAQEAERKGWSLEKPYVIEKLRTWLIWTHGELTGSPWILICQQSGDVLKSGGPGM